ncbi:SGNH/GDSL hydrolase family protein [Mucilaginibacter lacusdianchii]|uniref:SGNH/GDSL hydrolase family protein n=1 Tax=Mucilaginibacter lacusdianchii TaxID=2684211 RepID=UPI00131D025F|nr:SGNH/GDSL hydrolase family protein [Mucilaginibacter sp. JXJ CY 39]
MGIFYKKLGYILLFVTTAVVSGCKKEKQETVKESITIPKAVQNQNVDTVKTPVDTSTKVIVVLGSSTAAGFGTSKPDSSWVNRLQNRFLTDNKKFKVVNLAYGGFTTYQVMPTTFITPSGKPQVITDRNITEALRYHPSMILINLPTNDIASNYSDEEIINNFKTITAIIDAQKIDYILTGTQPRNFSGSDQRFRLKTLDDKLASTFKGHVNSYLSQLSSPTYSILDMYSAGDGIHLNDRGHRLIYESFIKHFQQHNIFDFKIIKL